jgi:hypothetical protein
MDESPFIRYASFIFLGLTLVVGYAIMRAFGARWKQERSGGEQWLEKQLAEARAERERRRRTLDAPSGLEGPAYDPEQRAAIDRARAEGAEPPPGERPSP